MASFILRRLAQMFVTLVGISIISWVIITLAPGGPIGLTLDPKASPKVIEQMMKNYDLINPSTSSTTCGSKSFSLVNFIPSKTEGR